jgi:hypothetical protein
MNPNLLIATPCYGCMLHTDYFASMTALLRGALQSNINVDFLHIGNQVTKKARNSMISYFHEHKEYTHYIHIDADMGVPNDCIPKMLKRNVDVIGVPVPLKGYNSDGSPVLNIGEILNITEDGLAETTHVGNAVLMFNRKAVDALIEISELYEDNPQYSRGETVGNKAWDVFYVGVMEDGIYRPEDYSTCYKLRKLGFKIHLDMTIPVKHNGMHGFQTTPEILKSACAGFGGMAISEKDWNFISDVLDKVKAKTVLEFGSVISTNLISDNGYDIISYETDLTRKGDNIKHWDGESLDIVTQFDLAFVDGPQGGHTRNESTRIASKVSNNIIVHDCDREWEKKWQLLHLQDFNLVSKEGLCAWFQR